MIILYCIAGIIAGIIAGLIPGLHSNNIAIIAAASPIFGNEAMAFMLSMCTVQIFTEFIPSTILGAPSDTTFEAVLPAHKLLLEGKGYDAICHTTFGAIIAIIIGAALSPIIILLLEENATQIIYATPPVLIFALGIFFFESKGTKQKLAMIFALIAAGTQGILFNGQIFPLISGYFGIAGTLYSLKEKNTQVKQESTTKLELENIKETLVGLIGGAIVAIMPGIGSNTAGGIINTFRKNPGSKKYLTMLGAINSSNFFFTLATMLALSKARNGAMLALQEKIILTPQTYIMGTAIILATAGIGGILTLIIAKKMLEKINLNTIKAFSIATIIGIILLVGIFNGTNGLIALLFSTALGIFTITQKIRRSSCMAALIIPVLIFYVFILY